MIRFTMIGLFGLLIGGLLFADAAQGFEGFFAARRARRANWHQGYYQGRWGAPLALVVPPTVDMQTNYRSTVGSAQVTRIWPQFRHGYPGDPTPAITGNRYQPAPHWPSHTNQMGIYYLRGPW